MLKGILSFLTFYILSILQDKSALLYRKAAYNANINEMTDVSSTPKNSFQLRSAHLVIPTPPTALSSPAVHINSIKYRHEHDV